MHPLPVGLGKVLYCWNRICLSEQLIERNRPHLCRSVIAVDCSSHRRNSCAGLLLPFFSPSLLLRRSPAGTPLATAIHRAELARTVSTAGTVRRKAAHAASVSEKRRQSPSRGRDTDPSCTTGGLSCLSTSSTVFSFFVPARHYRAAGCYTLVCDRAHEPAGEGRRECRTLCARRTGNAEAGCGQTFAGRGDGTRTVAVIVRHEAAGHGDSHSVRPEEIK